MGKRISIEKSVVINAAAGPVFAFISDGSNDPRWRTEVDRMDVQGPTEPATQMVEYSTFFRWFHTVTPTVIQTLQPPTRFVLQTPDTHPDWLRSTRTVETIDSQTSRFVYRLEFDVSTFKQVSPVVPPAAAIRPWYARRIKRYLRNAKRLIETSDATPRVLG
jgi:hypothetical protein